jgi:hypothetical protein
MARTSVRVVAGLAVACAAVVANAQTTCVSPTNCVTNPSFEAGNLFNPPEPNGWFNLSNPAQSQRRQIGDSLTPPAVARTGQWSINIRTPGNGDFRGFTTDGVNFFQPGFPFFDPAWDWANPKDIRVTAWYYIPTSDPLVGDSSGIKLNIKGLNQDYATLDPWGGAAPTVSGDTNNEWRFYEIVWSAADIVAQVQLNSDLGVIPFPPTPPNRVKLTIGRFAFGAPVSSGVIFWDDVTVEYLDPAPACPACPADFDQDGGVTGADVEAFFLAFESGDACGDTDLDGGVTGADVEAFFLAFEAGGC